MRLRCDPGNPPSTLNGERAYHSTETPLPYPVQFTDTTQTGESQASSQRHRALTRLARNLPRIKPALPICALAATASAGERWQQINRLPLGSESPAPHWEAVCTPSLPPFIHHPHPCALKPGVRRSILRAVVQETLLSPKRFDAPLPRQSPRLSEEGKPSIPKEVMFSSRPHPPFTRATLSDLNFHPSMIQCSSASNAVIFPQ
jgi:hypothetical protein